MVIYRERVAQLGKKT